MAELIEALPLDDPHWGRINHCYGPASDIADMVAAAALAISKGSLPLAKALSNLDPDWIERIVADNR